MLDKPEEAEKTPEERQLSELEQYELRHEQLKHILKSQLWANGSFCSWSFFTIADIKWSSDNHPKCCSNLNGSSISMPTAMRRCLTICSPLYAWCDIADWLLRQSGARCYGLPIVPVDLWNCKHTYSWEDKTDPLSAKLLCALSQEQFRLFKVLPWFGEGTATSLRDDPQTY